MADENEQSFMAPPDVAADILRALGGSADDDDVSGFTFGDVMPRVDASMPALRPKDAGSHAGLIDPTEAGWTAWKKIG